MRCCVSCPALRIVERAGLSIFGEKKRGRLRMVGWIVLILIAGFLAYVRLAPVDVDKWHNPQLPVMGPGEYPGVGRFVGQYVQEGDGRYALARLHAVALATPHTQVIAGSPDAGKITYMTRSKVIGFPDFSTVTLTPLPGTGKSTLQLFGRLRFGKADFGVNEARIKDWADRADLK